MLRQKKTFFSDKFRISFDLDEVLFVNPQKYKTEPPLPFPFCKHYKERLRLGTVDLIHTLQAQDIEVWVYTSSFRSQSYIRRLFRHYGVQFDDIVNGQRHQAEVQRDNPRILPTKLPNRYRIALHIDDAPSVAANGKANGFDVLTIYEPDDHWTQVVLDKVAEVKKKYDTK